ncbi:MAG: DUF1211 domain-containing protein [Alcanivoracaceae bacterium]|nr:DUF1211 domain-containing protein [Alcanivoracaceae bacterium]
MDLNKLPIKNGFRLRGTDITRLETFTDAAFAFAVTMLVIAGDSVPTNYDALMKSLKDIPSFAASIAMILYIWFGHLQWSRRYGLEDGISVMLSGMLILSILVFVYPLKLVFAAMFAFFSGGFLLSEFVVTNVDDMTGLFVFYGFGFTITCLILSSLFLYTLSKTKQLKLNPREVFETKVNIALWLMVALPAFTSAIAAWLLPPTIGVWSGFMYWLYLIISPIFSIKTNNKRQALFDRLEND